ncbi:MAG TPA: hypothetical protein VIF82_17880 [Burkholderiaceae bacterium]|jgi:hypothetical protein
MKFQKFQIGVMKHFAALLLGTVSLLTFNSAWADCTSTIVPTSIAPNNGGGLDIQGTLVSSSCTCVSKNTIAIDTSMVNSTVVNRYLAIAMIAKMNNTKIIAYSLGSCVPDWYVGSAVLTYVITTE